MIEITNESYEKYNKQFPETMTLLEIAEKLDQMDPRKTSEYNIILCYELFNGLCCNYITYNSDVHRIITNDAEYKAFKRRYKSLPQHSFYDAYCEYLEGKRNKIKANIHKYMATFSDASPAFGEEDLAAGLLLGFKNAYEGFWQLIKEEIKTIPHDMIVEYLCDVIEAFYNAPSNEEAIDVLSSAYQHYPESPTINELLGVVYFDNRQYGNAIAAFERLYEEETNSFNTVIHSQDQVYFFLGYASDKMKDRKMAISYYKKAVDINPFCPSAANNLGYAYYRERLYDKAYAVFKRCIEEKLDAEISYPIINFARLLYAMGKYKEAKEFIRTSPVSIPKSLRDKIKKAPNKDKENQLPAAAMDESDEQATPVIKATIDRKVDQFQSEKILEDELTMRMEAGMEVFGLPLKIYKRRGEYGRQYIFPNGRLDLLAEDTEGNLYIIELKKDRGYDDAYKQTVEYIEWFQKHKAKTKKVYGIICLNDPGEKLIQAVRKDERVQLFEYQISYREIL